MKFGRLAVPAVVSIGLVLGGCGGSATPSDSPSSQSPTPTTSKVATAKATQTNPEGSKRGGVVEGFPLKLIPKLPDGKISGTVDVVHGKMRQVSMTGITDYSADKVLKFYAAPLKKAGFKQLKTKKVDKSKSTIFSRSGGDELITVTVAPGKNGKQNFTVGGQIKDKSKK
ncbi:hypothetical protein [Spelaeicoccus albus]|uniref:Lipoprotein n=1 Tax=Spelaeicoccus albus TaxID=1280376 RepID=A0A7Z0IIZ1_9MICO|nr:hypothetical protein [Spelaeicoccus albus]NYI69005.1 hypothetical protein [Spelaeicoccus albus]